MRIYLKNLGCTRWTKIAFINGLKTSVLEGKTYNLGLIQLLEIYDIDRILEAISSIQYDGISFLVQDNTENNKIIRYLEYGGENVKPPKIITKVINDLYVKEEQ